MSEIEVRSHAVLLVFGWATPTEGVTLDALIEHMTEIGNTVLEVDRVNNRLKLLDQSCNLTPEQAAELQQRFMEEGVQRG